MRVVIDHIAGSRRGQRQEFEAGSRVRFGRHPDCEVAFDPHRDLDASSRHAELKVVDAGWVLLDLGSSNGTYVEGRRVTEAPVVRDLPLRLEFGPGGPRVRLFIGEQTAIDNLPPPIIETTRPRWLVPGLGGGLFVVAIILLAVRC